MTASDVDSTATMPSQIHKKRQSKSKIVKILKIVWKEIRLEAGYSVAALGTAACKVLAISLQ